MGIRLINYVNNQLQTPALYTDAFAGRPAAGIYGRLFMSTDTKEIYQDLATSWSLLADAGAGSGTLQSVTTNGNTTTTGITILSNNLSLTNATSNFNYKAITVGSILFSGDVSGLITQDNANFFWDNTNKRLGLGTATPSSKLDIHSGSGTNATFNGTGVTNAILTFQSAGTSKWSVGNFVSSIVANDFNIYDNVNTVSRLQVHNTGVVNIPTSLIIGTITPTSIYALDVTGTGRFTGALNGTSASFSGLLTSTLGNNTQIFQSATATTGYQYWNMNNTSGQLIYGIEGSTGGSVIAGAAAYSTFIGTGSISTAPLYLITNGTIRQTINGSTGAATFSSNVGIGGSTFNYAAAGRTNLVLNGSTDSLFEFQNGNSSSGYILSNSTLLEINALSIRDIIFTTNGSIKMRITSGGIVQIAGLTSNGTVATQSSNGSLYVSSDANLKIEDGFVENGLGKVLALKPRYFYWKDKEAFSADRQLGFYAQEVNAISEETANTPADGCGWGIYDRGLVALLTSAIQEQQAQIQNLQEQINILAK